MRSPCSEHPLLSQIDKLIPDNQVICQSGKPHAFIRVAHAFLAGFTNFGKPLADAEIHAAVPLCVHHSPEGDHVHALRSRERGCFLVVQTLWAEKIQSTTDAGSLNTFGRNEIEVAPISSALLRIACLVILYKTCRSGPRTRSRWGIRTGMRTRARLLKQNGNRRDGA